MVRGWVKVVVDLLAVIDDDGVAKLVEGRFRNLQPHFCSHVYWEL
ncbi:hypothetical protein HanLR1_Chr00c0002g0688781 [Helianthus annuus]|nr:hypothetical protein HanLR1_Chr00c0002g0688781 [Helianthus annuus]